MGCSIRSVFSLTIVVTTVLCGCMQVSENTSQPLSDATTVVENTATQVAPVASATSDSFFTVVSNGAKSEADIGVELPGFSSIDRTILREPEYEIKPGYCLLVFGPKFETQVWLVADGETIYVDRNANGDLTDDGETLLPQSGSGSGNRHYEKTDLVPADGLQEHTQFTIGCYQTNEKKIHHFIKVKVNGEIQQYAGWRPIFSNSPESAKILQFGGKFAPQPLRKHQLSLTEDDQELHLSFFTKGHGLNSNTMLGYSAVPESTIPIAEIEWPSADSAVPIRTEVQLTQRC